MEPLLFMGSPPVAVSILKTLLKHGYPVPAVITQPDKPAGRGQKIAPPAVKVFAQQHSIEVYQPTTLRDPNFLDTVQRYQPQAIIVAAYGKLIPPSILALPPWGCINIHFSLLPRYRGASCVASAIRHGDVETGVTIMQVTEKLDAGPIYRQERVGILPDETTADLEARLADHGGRLLIAVLNDLEQGRIASREQDDSEASYAPLIRKEEAKIDWTKSACQIRNLIRAFIPWPVAFGILEQSRIKIYEAKVVSEESLAKPAGEIVKVSPEGVDVACGKGVLRILSVQPENKKRLSIAELLRGDPKTFTAGKKFNESYA